MVYAAIALAVVVVLYLVFRSKPAEPSSRDRVSQPPVDHYRPQAAADNRDTRARPSRLSVADMLPCVRDLQARTAQWPEIWSRLNPYGDTGVQQLLMDLRNDGMQFAPSDGLSKIEQACLSLAGD